MLNYLLFLSMVHEYAYFYEYIWKPVYKHLRNRNVYRLLFSVDGGLKIRQVRLIIVVIQLKTYV